MSFVTGSGTLSRVHLLVTTDTRDRIDPCFGRETQTPSIADLVARAHGAREVWIAGGEPTLRPDLPELIARLHDGGRPVGMVTDGLALVSARALSPLIEAGLGAVRLRVHAARPEAHDWLVERAGALKGGLRAAKRLREAGVRIELETRLTRPSAPFVSEVVELAHSIGAKALELAPMTMRSGDEIIALVARWGLLASPLSSARRAATRLGVTLTTVDVPQCVLSAASRTTVADGVHCARCVDGCSGFAKDYVSRFGAMEVARDTFAAEQVSVAFGAASGTACAFCRELDRDEEATREVRLKLVRIARQGVKRLRIIGPSLFHPAALALLRETTLLGFERVEVMAEVSPLAKASDAELYALSGIDLVCGAFFGADAASHDQHVGREGAFEDSLSGLERFRDLAGGEIGAFGVSHDRSWTEGWGKLPGEPRFATMLVEPVG